MSIQKPLGVESDSFDILKEAVMELLNSFPGLNGDNIRFDSLDEDGGISMSPDSGTLIYKEKRDIIGGVTRECQFPFFVIYRSGAANPAMKMGISDFLDTIGAWICREPVTIDAESYQLTEYPNLTGGRRITRVIRFNSYALEPNPNNTQDWLIPITVHYLHEFTM